MTGDIRVFQIHYRPEHKASLDPAFIPIDNQGQADPLLELAVLQRLHGSPALSGARVWGAVSWKFHQKTGLVGAQWLSSIAANDGFDAYYCNPHPDLEGLYHNLWLQGQTTHPDFLTLARPVLAQAGAAPDASIELLPSWAFAAANYIVASPAFWDCYLPFVQGAVDRALHEANPEMRERYFSSAADSKGIHAGAGYLPFIVERLFTTFVTSEAGRRFKVAKFPLPVRLRQLSVHHKRLTEMKDAAWKSRSAWLANCWVNYRNLFLAQLRGREWAQQHLRSVNTRRLVFGEFPLAAPWIGDAH